MFSVRSSKNIKISTFAKASKSSFFRSDNQRHISLDLSHSCRNQKRLISLTNSQTFFEIIRLARCKYSKLVSVYSFSEGCAYIRRRVCDYSKRCVRIRTLNKLLFIFLCEFKFIIFSNISLKKSLIFRILFIIYAVFICVETLCNSKNETKNVLNARDVNWDVKDARDVSWDVKDARDVSWDVKDARDVSWDDSNSSSFEDSMIDSSSFDVSMKDNCDEKRNSRERDLKLNSEDEKKNSRASNLINVENANNDKKLKNEVYVNSW